MSRTAVVLFNLGGPDSLDAVAPFLLNLFSDPAILTVPAPVRWVLARLIARRRTPVAKGIYAEMGGRSPLLEQTREQATALEAQLDDARVFIAMRYWHPRAAAVVREVKAWQPDRVVLLPLYPQFSTTSTGSSIAEWHRETKAAGLDVPVSTICCHSALEGFIGAMAEAAVPLLRAAVGRPRLLYSAHGLPARVIRAGDCYQFQVERSALALTAAIRRLDPALDFEPMISYQSRATPEEWLKPDTEDEVKRAGAEGRSLVILPIAFVSEHSETLVELDREYRDVAAAHGVPSYGRVPTVRATAAYIGGLADLVRTSIYQGGAACETGGRICPADRTACPARMAAATA